MKIKISEAERQVLDYLVAKREGFEPPSNLTVTGQKFSRLHAYSTDWAQGGPIIEREKIGLSCENDEWEAHKWISPDKHLPLINSGPTPLIAAMRVYVASKLGDEVDIPEELTGVAA